MTHHTDAERAEFDRLLALADNFGMVCAENGDIAKARKKLREALAGALAARRAPAAPVPQGWKMVPVEPPQEALYAIDRLVDDPRAFEDSESFWDYLLAAAPQPPEAFQTECDLIGENPASKQGAQGSVQSENLVAQVQMPEPWAISHHNRVQYSNAAWHGETPDGTKLYTDQQVRQLLAAHGIQEQST